MNRKLWWAIALAIILILAQIIANETILFRFVNVPAMLLVVIYLGRQWRNALYGLLIAVTLAQSLVLGVNLGVYLLAASVILLVLYVVSRVKWDQFPYGHYVWAALGVAGYVLLATVLVGWSDLNWQWNEIIITTILGVVLGKLLSLGFGHVDDIHYTVKV